MILIKETHRPDYLDDVIRIQHVLNKNGYTCDLEYAEDLWQKHSDDYCAGWLIMEHYEDDFIWLCIKEYLT